MAEPRYYCHTLAETEHAFLVTRRLEAIILGKMSRTKTVQVPFLYTTGLIKEFILEMVTLWGVTSKT